MGERGGRRRRGERKRKGWEEEGDEEGDEEDVGDDDGEEDGEMSGEEEEDGGGGRDVLVPARQAARSRACTLMVRISYQTKSWGTGD